MKHLHTTLAIALCYSFTSCTESIDPVSDRDAAKQSLLGTWMHSSSTTDENENYEEHYKVTRREDGTVTNQNILIDHKRKSYSIEELNGKWEVEGTYYFEIYPAWADKFKIITIQNKLFSYISLDSFTDVIADHEIKMEDVMTEKRTTASYSIPSPPEDYTRKEP